ncbi:MAG TPA: FAD-dependent oxidoreductase [Xanthobacteraceae bacterium]|nr:FAD-dependent oxidoreductase [Xanthobacteraceae bacterium]
MAEPVATETKIVRRQDKNPQRVDVDICVVGAGSAGLSAALEAAKLGRRVALIDSLPTLGGQMVNSIIGTFCGLFANGTHGHQFTYGMADDILRDLGKIPKALYRRHGPVTTVVYYDEVLLGRWIEEAIRAAGITVILGAVLRNVNLEGRRVHELDIATRYGDIKLTATGFVDASGDAALTWQAGFACRESGTRQVYGTQMVVLENINEAAHPTREEMAKRMTEKKDKYQLLRTNAVSFVIPGRSIAALNMTHTDTPLEAIAASKSQLDGKAQADRCVEFLKNEFPECFGNSRVRAYGNPGIRQTRWISGRHQLTLDEVRNQTMFDDAVARTAWPVELHDHGSGYVWQTFPEDHTHYVPLGSMTPVEADNVVAAGRCIDADLAALSSVRVMGPCIAMGHAAAHALDLAGKGSVHQLDNTALRKRLHDNLERNDAQPKTEADSELKRHMQEAHA